MFHMIKFTLALMKTLTWLSLVQIIHVLEPALNCQSARFVPRHGLLDHPLQRLQSFQRLVGILMCILMLRPCRFVCCHKTPTPEDGCLTNGTCSLTLGSLYKAKLGTFVDCNKSSEHFVPVCFVKFLLPGALASLMEHFLFGIALAFARLPSMIFRPAVWPSK